MKCSNLMALRCGFFRKKHRKKHLCRHDKNYYFFCKSNILVINLIAGSRNMIKVLENMSFAKVSRFYQIPTISYCFLLFLNGAGFWKVQWINRK